MKVGSISPAGVWEWQAVSGTAAAGGSSTELHTKTGRSQDLWGGCTAL